MIEKIIALIKETEQFTANNKEVVENFRIKFLSKKGIMAQLFVEFKTVPVEQKKEIGQKLNELKNKVQQKVNELKKSLEVVATGQDADEKTMIDLTLPGDSIGLGTRHPISIVRNEIIKIFSRIGFTVSEGPEIEDDWHVFTALNFPEEHPARDMQDTFFIENASDTYKSSNKSVSGKHVLLRTQTSSVQIRVMENQKPPIRIISPGRSFRNEAISARAHCFFHQVEGLYIDKNVSFADLKQTLIYFSKEMFGSDTKIRLRPSFFPFTEPSGELDISCKICGGKGCNICKYTGWLEILGCGMVDPNVLENNKIDSKEYTGFAFGMGIERIAMLRYEIKDIRLFFENDVRFLRQFEAAI